MQIMTEYQSQTDQKREYHLEGYIPYFGTKIICRWAKQWMRSISNEGINRCQHKVLGGVAIVYAAKSESLTNIY